MPDALTLSLASAIARMEGGGPGLNNPGNITDPRTGQFVSYSSPSAGQAALYAQIDRNRARGLTLYEFFGGQRNASGNVVAGGYPGYASAQASPRNDPMAYAQFVGHETGLDPNVPVPPP